MLKGEKVYNIYWDWKAIQRTVPPEAVKGRLLGMGFEFDEAENAYVIAHKMSSDVFRGDCYNIGINTKAIEGTSVASEDEKRKK